MTLRQTGAGRLEVRKAPMPPVVVERSGRTVAERQAPVGEYHSDGNASPSVSGSDPIAHPHRRRPACANTDRPHCPGNRPPQSRCARGTAHRPTRSHRRSSSPPPPDRAPQASRKPGPAHHRHQPDGQRPTHQGPHPATPASPSTAKRYAFRRRTSPKPRDAPTSEPSGTGERPQPRGGCGSVAVGEAVGASG